VRQKIQASATVRGTDVKNSVIYLQNEVFGFGVGCDILATGIVIVIIVIEDVAIENVASLV
jgi:hypothetical protein